MLSHYFEGVPVYASIEKFVPDRQEHPALFRCMETMDLMCDGIFKEMDADLGLRGFEFVPVDESYRFDPWGGLQETVAPRP